jgi:hypothetical protein
MSDPRDDVSDEYEFRMRNPDAESAADLVARMQETMRENREINQHEPRRVEIGTAWAVVEFGDGGTKTWPVDVDLDSELFEARRNVATLLAIRESRAGKP